MEELKNGGGNETSVRLFVCSLCLMSGWRMGGDRGGVGRDQDRD